MSSLRVFPSSEALADAAADAIVEIVGAALAARGSALVALAGGTTPVAAYRRVSGSTRAKRVDWERVDFFFGDERCVPPDDARSNFRTAHEHLLDPLGVAPERVHRIRGELGAPAAAEAYEDELRGALAGDGRFDLVLLGLGEDGHTASLFPGAPAPGVGALAVAARAPAEPRERVTLTPAALLRSRFTLFLVEGERKARALAAALRDETSIARRVVPPDGASAWLVDAAAASLAEAPP